MFVTLDIEAEIREARRALQGDAEARERLFEQIYARILRYHRKLAGVALAEELSQETMLRLIRSFDQLREPERFVPWAFRIATNVWRDHHRSRTERDAVAAGESPHASRAAEREELAQRVLDAVSRLPEIYRAALTLRYLEGLEYEAMSEILEISVPTLRSHIARGRRMIRKQLEG